MKQLNKNQGGFTLLELLVVTAILAIIAGAVISAIGGKEEQAQGQVTVHTMAAVESATRQHAVLERAQPNRLESLLCVSTGTPAGALAQDTSTIGATFAFGSTGASPTHGMSADLIGELSEVTVPVEGIAALRNAGITELMYVSDDDGNCQEFADQSSYVLFDLPTTNVGGAGISVTLDAATPTTLMVHGEPVEIGGVEGDFIALFGIGTESGLVQEGFIARPPRDGGIAPVEAFSHYSLAYRIGTDTGASPADGIFQGDEALEVAQLVGVVDAGGDAYAEEILEAAGLQGE